MGQNHLRALIGGEREEEEQRERGRRGRHIFGIIFDLFDASATPSKHILLFFKLLHKVIKF